ncbi:hypothetical protein BU25DRAFT_69646 [Macroventuria anomochaeta]|uniref:Uncharacterized protein n=1 Tax=Macroventuria anomochaeta TaxID=301207 RepID=A0ACB6S142_9PLEO|nr:uncharacterized protein BU25DRAFT_69646 [Macroventuria anomochaeta]KAF2627113.1 hypothetical protein BU25DRAFT_69646 [Macroventuria anomochaeta]
MRDDQRPLQKHAASHLISLNEQRAAHHRGATVHLVCQTRDPMFWITNLILATWKRKTGLNYFSKCPNSPDLSPIENCWQPVKQYLKNFPHWDGFEARELAYEGWNDQVLQDFFNQRIDNIPQRLQDWQDMDGRIIGYYNSNML